MRQMYPFFKHCGGMTKHVYTGITSNHEQAAMQMYLEVLDWQSKWATDRPVIIGEFSVNRPASGEYKSRVYRQFFELLKDAPGIQAAYSFTSSWHPSPDTNQEGWLEAGIKL